MAKSTNFEEYARNFPEDVQLLLETVRSTIKAAAPDAEEIISYDMPAFKYKGMLVYFAAYKKHIGFYPMPSAIEAFKDELSIYKGAKGSVQFPLNKPLPLELIAKITSYRLKENLKKEYGKKT